MADWLGLGVIAAILYGLHQVFTRLASDRIDAGLGGFIVEATAAISILAYLGYLRFMHQWPPQVTPAGVWWSVATGVCVGVGTLVFFIFFQRGGPLSAVPVILAVGAAIMALIGVMAFREPVTRDRLLGIALSVAGLYLLRR